MNALQILPGTGRGTIRRMVEGQVPHGGTSTGRDTGLVPLHPDACGVAVPLPVSGRI
jgi:hypothetical protein